MRSLIDTETLKKLYEDLSSILELYSGWLFDDLLRNIGWGIIQILVWINDWVEGVATSVVSLGGLYDNPAMERFVEVMQPLAMALFVVSITVVGFLFMLNKIEKRNEVVMNVLIAVSIIVILPTLVSMMDDLLNEGLYVLDEPGSLSDDVLKRNIADVMYYVESNFNYANGLNKDTMSGSDNLLPHPPHPNEKEIGTTDYTFGNQLKNPNTIEINEKLDIRKDEGWFSWTTDDWVNELKKKRDTHNGQGKEGVGYDLLTHRLVSTGDGGTRVVELNKNTVPATNLGQQSYYRYHVNWGIAIATLAVTAFALVIATIKIGRAMFDLAFHQVFAMFTAATDLTGGQRLKKVLTEISNTFAVIFIMMLLLRLFIVYAQWSNDLERHIGMVGVILLLIAGAWALIDAPDIVQRLMGVDAGLRSGYQAMTGSYVAGKMAGAGVKMTTQAGGKAIKTGGKVGGSVVAGSVGFKRGLRNDQHIKPIPSYKNAEPYQNQREGRFSTFINKENPIKASSSKEGHIYPNQKHTLLGGNKKIQRANHYLTRAHNTGYDLGGKIKGKVPEKKQTNIPRKDNEQ